MGNNELQMFVLGIMAARNLRPMDLHRATGISRKTLTEITKGRYNLGSERTRETLEQLADGLGVPRAEVMKAAGLSPEPPAPSDVPADIMNEVFEAQRQLAASFDRLAEALRAAGKPVPDPPKPPTSGRGPRRQPPLDGPHRNRRKDSRGSSS